MMKAMHKQQGASLEISLLTNTESLKFIEKHTDVLNHALEKTGISEATRRSMETSNFVFSGIKTFHELNEAFPSLFDENGDRKSFERFYKDVRTVDETYNKNYLKAEYNFVTQSGTMAAKWQRFAADGDRYLLQYRTIGDNRVRESHKKLDRITLPLSSIFWDKYFPPNGWGCRCGVIQVLKGKYPVSDEQQALQMGDDATDEKGTMFRFNPGKQRSAWADYNPYTIKDCVNCKNRSSNLVHIPNNQLCQACAIIREMSGTYKAVPTYYGGVRISSKHGKSEKVTNIRIASYLADKHNQEIDLLPRGRKKTADAYNRTLGIEQEYKTNKTNSVNAVDKAIRDGAKQSANIVLWIESDIALGTLSSAIENRVRRCPEVLSLMVVIKGKDATYSREQILTEDWKIKQEDLK
jgi:SPP1 gp7 family putative phage head morphogenesis protein